MKAVYDKNCNCVAWLDERTMNVFALDMRWIGFVDGKSFFSRDTRWLGGFSKGTFQDKWGRPVGWIFGVNPASTLPLMQPLTPLGPLTPLRPLRPPAPLRPAHPLAPLGGWSPFDWDSYIGK